MPQRRNNRQNQIAALLSLVGALRRMGIPMWVMLPLGGLTLLAVLFRPAIEQRLGVRFGLPNAPIAGAGDRAEQPPAASKRTGAADQDGQETKVRYPPASTPLEHGLGDYFTELRSGVFKSPAGLRYRRGSKQGHRIRHVMAHASDQPKRAGPHGVFDANDPLEVFQLIDEAYRLARSEKDTSTRYEDGRTKHTVNLRRRIGFVGGASGNADGRPEARRLRIILDGVNVITAYPVR